jgi:VWFA-related protein
MLVEYGPVEIAGRRFICPVRSLALSEAVATAESFTDNSTTAWLNETEFTHYHRFASSSRVLEEAANNSAPGAAPVAPEQPATNPTQAAPQNTASIAPTQPAIAPAQPAENKTPASDQPPAPQTPPVEPPASVDAPATNARASETSPASGPSSTAPPAAESIASNAPQPSAVSPDENQPRFRIDVNSVLVPVVVVDKQGRSLAGLGRDDFTVEEDGKKRTIVGFTVIKSAANDSKGLVDGGQSSAAGGGAPDTTAGTSQSAAPATRHVIFLFDDRHITTSDLALVQNAATHLFEKALAPSDDAAVLSLFGINSGLTHDRAALQSAVMKLAVHLAFQHGKEDCPDVDYYSADQIISKHNPTEFQIAVEKARQCSFSQAMVQSSSNDSGMDNPTNPFQAAAKAAAAHALAIGEEDARVSLVSVRNVVRVMAKMPGQRTLIFVSPGFLTLSAETMAIKSEIMNIAAASDVIVNALDARGLYAGNVDASQGGTTSSLALASGQMMDDHLASMQANENVMSELAEGTGGRFFHNNNDLQGGIESLTAGPENLYLLEISFSEVKANGAYHRFQVKLDQPGVKITARKGYFAPKVEKGKK